MKYEIKWWKDWLEGDFLEKQKMVEKLPYIKELKEMIEEGTPDTELRKSLLKSMTLQLNSFFEDLVDACYVKYYNEFVEDKNEHNK
jgi:hypothetical protein